MKCRNGLHEIDPDDPWRGPSRERCRECNRATKARLNKSEKGLAASRIRNARFRKTPKGKAAKKRWARTLYVTRQGAVKSARYVAQNRSEVNRRDRLRMRVKRTDPIFRQMSNDCRRLGLSAAEWRRQVEQGIIQIKEK